MTAVAPALAVAVAPALAALGPAGGVAAPPERTRQPGGGRGSQRALAGAGGRRPGAARSGLCLPRPRPCGRP